MASIKNDQDLRHALNQLPTDRQRIIGALFAQSVLHLNQEERIERALETAVKTDAGEAELEDAFRAAKTRATKTYTACGTDTDWLAQADHFVAAAAATALTPDALQTDRQNRAWKAAVQARMAKNCELMEDEDGESQTEAEQQYRIANEYLDKA